ncbi:MAG TPA: hypothetical protein VGQ51_08805 [Puia sp.]|jgi:hypothetical protein|nr:hypothetical protein [Puia sp.]
MKAPIFSFLTSVLFLLLSHPPAGAQRPAKRDTFLVDPSKPVLPPPRTNPETRAHIKKEAVAEYREKSKHGEFVVKLFQTSKTMSYRIDVDFEGLPGSDTVHLPDLGNEPRPALQKGDSTTSCLVGFLDNDNKFREVKLIFVTPKGNQFKITTVRHWHVSTHYRLVANQ